MASVTSQLIEEVTATSIYTRLHSVTYQKTVIIVITALLTSYVTLYGISVLANSALAFETHGRNMKGMVLLNGDFVRHTCRILALWC